MEEKSQCKVHYGDGDDDEDAELEDLHDYSSRFSFSVVALIFIPLFMPNLSASSFGMYILRNYVYEVDDQIVALSL
ncbi:hypothetical protein Bca4012_084834 [Brassica carinata]